MEASASMESLSIHWGEVRIANGWCDRSDASLEMDAVAVLRIDSISASSFCVYRRQMCGSVRIVLPRLRRGSRPRLSGSLPRPSLFTPRCADTTLEHLPSLLSAVYIIRVADVFEARYYAADNHRPPSVGKG